MHKKTIILLYVLSLIFLGVAAIALLFNWMLLYQIGIPRIVIALALFFVASVLGLIAWIGTLINQGKQQQWGWFICTLLFGGIALLIYRIAVPERLPQLPVPDYGQVSEPQPPIYYSPNPRSYPLSPNDPRP